MPRCFSLPLNYVVAAKKGGLRKRGQDTRALHGATGYSGLHFTCEAPMDRTALPAQEVVPRAFLSGWSMEPIHFRQESQKVAGRVDPNTRLAASASGSRSSPYRLSRQHFDPNRGEIRPTAPPVHDSHFCSSRPPGRDNRLAIRRRGEHGRRRRGGGWKRHAGR